MADDLFPLLKDLLRLPGLSAYEGPVRERIRTAWEPLADEIEVSRMGSLHARKRGAAEAPRPSLLLAAHMDAIGMMVMSLAEGYLRITEVGGLDPRVLPGQIVTVHGRRELPGVIVRPPPAALPDGVSNGPPGLEVLLIDVGLPADEVTRLVRPGDLISFAQEPFEMGDDLIVGHSLDNRASVGALTVCLQELQTRQHAWDVLAVATTQEEETFAGARTSGYALRPSVAVAVDVTFGASPGSPEHRTFPLSMGPVNGWGPNIHPALHKELNAAAARVEIPITTEALAQHSGTDAYALQIAGEGIPTGVVSIPLRYMHTPVEVVSLTDVRRTGRLLAEFAAGLSPTFLDQLEWD